MKEYLWLLDQLSEPGTVLVDTSGSRVSPRRKMEINTWKKVQDLHREMEKLKETRWFPMLSKDYRAKRSNLRMCCREFLSDFLDHVSQKLASKEYVIQQQEEDDD